MVSSRHEGPHLVQFRLRSQMDFLFEVLCLWFTKHVWLLKCLLHSAQGNLTPAYAHGGNAMQSLHVCSQWWVAALALDFLHALHTYFFRHRARYIQDHVIVLFDIIVQQINFLGGVDLLLENCLHTPGLDRRLSYTAENVLRI